MAQPALAVHGGAGSPPRGDETPYREALAAGLAAGWTALESGGALDAVQAAVELLEDAPLFNAGRGSVLTACGAVEMDAAIAFGPGLRAGAVAAVSRVRHPVRLAREVMDHTEHVLLVGPAAERYAIERDLELMKPGWFVTPRERERLQRVLERRNPAGSPGARPPAPPRSRGGGTVGAV